jgi:hypothetical protein
MCTRLRAPRCTPTSFQRTDTRLNDQLAAAATTTKAGGAILYTQYDHAYQLHCSVRSSIATPILYSTLCIVFNANLRDSLSSKRQKFGHSGDLLFRISGFPDFRISGFPDFRICFFSGHPEIRKSGNPEIRNNLGRSTQ